MSRPSLLQGHNGPLGSGTDQSAGWASAVVLIDNSGVGRSQGQVARTFADWARNYVDVMEAIGIRRADVMGFSMGGCVAQMVALNAPSLVPSLILCGTVPSIGDGVVKAPLGPFNKLKAAVTVEEHRSAFLDAFFHTSERSQAAGMAAWDRITRARSDRSDHVDAQNAHRQAVSFAKFMDPKQAADASYHRFHELRLPVLIANGCNDLLLPTDNSILMWKKLGHANAQLHLYPDSGHGFLFQYATVFSGLINEFLDNVAEQTSRLQGSEMYA
ncbi:hydrolase, alpha/beta hydrolase fold family [Metarhizium acridum CQMa 102]|uniref:Hydrolase, alpha/beta hydrolase fold family n=1 Tax=Metarhizium acridum (strain CQMa 102) TaxID=655827 RepID=E9E4N6_METAQ|nr:hydrolase, alpha/beta hydrolase fold family [Metarhizium acridum CQMa 102]EFY89059.1 hydrolase, alpha/beta hydrolase fold family [Metarhizium acridum CQMa 102]